MAYFTSYGEQTPAGAAAEAVTGFGTTIPVHNRAMIRRVDAWTQEVAGQTTIWRILAAGVAVWGAAVTGIAAAGADTFIYIDATAAAVAITGTVQMSTGGGPDAGLYMSGITN